MSDASAEVARLTKNAMFHAIRGLNEINDQSHRFWREFDVTDCIYHLDAAILYLNELRATIERTSEE